MANFSDDFNRANSTDLGSSWVEVSGDWSIVSNRLSPGVDTGTVVLRAATAMDSSDHFAQVTIAVPAVASQGVWCRGNSNITSGYLWRNDGSTWDLFSVVGSTFNVIGTYAAAAAPGDVARVQAVGSTIKGFVNGVERVSVTDTGVPTGTSVGLRSGTVAGIRYDDFTAADVSAGAALTSADATETAQPLTGTKTTTLAPATATEAVQPVTGAKTGTLSTAATAEAAQQLVSSKTAPLPVAAQTETAQPLTAATSRSLTTTASVETAQPLAGAKSATLAPAAEASTARPLVTAGPDEDVDITVGAPYSTWSAGAPQSSRWKVGAPWN